MPSESATRPPLPVFGFVGGALVLLAVADAQGGWLVAAAEALRGSAGVSAITLRALWLLRVWLATVGVWSLSIEVVRRRAWAPPRLSGGPLWVWPAAVTIGLLGWTLPLGFLGDDFLWLDAWRREGLGVLRPMPGSPHYIPLGMLLCNLPHMVFGDSALPYRIVTIVLHGVGAGCVARAAHAGGLRPGLAAGAGMVFAATALAYEPLLWATGQFYLWAGVIVAAVCIVVQRGPERVSVRAAWCVAVAAAAAGFIIEQAAGLGLFLLVWSTVGEGRRCERRARIPLVLGPVVGTLALISLRAGTRAPTDALVSGAQVLRNIDHVLGGMLIANSPAGHMLGGWIGAHPVLRVAGAAVAGLAIGWLWWRAGSPGRTLLLAWVALWLPALLFAPQTSRYWYLPAIPASIGVMHLLAAFEARVKPAVPGGLWPVGAGAVAGWVLLGAVAMGVRAPDWRTAHAVARAVERDMVDTVRGWPTVERLVAADVPDGVGTGLWPAYVFNNGLAEALDRRLRALDIRWEGTVVMREGPHRPWPGVLTAAGGAALPEADLAAVARAPGTAVLVYATDSGGMELWAEPTP